MTYNRPMNFQVSRKLFLAAALGLLLAACGGGDSGTDSGATPPAGGGGAPPPTGGSATGSASLSWLPPQENTDGSTVTNLAGYRIYKGTSADSMSVVATVNNPGITSHVVSNLASGTHYFAVSAFNTDNTESDRSPAASKVIP